VRKILVWAVAVAVVSVIEAGPAWATFPGRNGTIAFTDSSSQLSTMNPDGTHKRRLTHLSSAAYVEAPQYSADGNWVVFDSSRLHNTDIYIIKSDGTQLKRVTNDATYGWSPSWSPDGKRIVYASDGSASQILIMHRDGSHIRALGSATGEYPRFSPNGKKIAYGGADGLIHVMSADGSHDHALTTGPATSDYPDWSPDGKKIGYTSNASGQSEVWIMRSDGTHAHQVTTTGAEFSPVFSPDGTKILYRNGHDPGSLFVSRLDGSARHKIAGTPGCCEGWQPLP
jgi:TolB protein